LGFSVLACLSPWVTIISSIVCQATRSSIISWVSSVSQR
jgi:hypothetical protein